MSVPFSGHSTRSRSPGLDLVEQGVGARDVVVEDRLALPERVEPGAGDVALHGADLERALLGLRVERDRQADDEDRDRDVDARHAGPHEPHPARRERSGRAARPTATTTPLSSGDAAAGRERRERRVGLREREAAPREAAERPEGRAQLLGRDPQEAKTTTCSPTAAPDGLSAARPGPGRPEERDVGASSVERASHGTCPTASPVQRISGMKKVRPQDQSDEGVPAGAVAAHRQVEQRDADERRPPPAGRGEGEPGQVAAGDRQDEGPPAGGFTGGHRIRVRQSLGSPAPARSRPTGPRVLRTGQRAGARTVVY